MSELLPNVSYTIDDLKDILGDNYMSALTRPESDIPTPDKPPVYSYNDLDDSSKLVYSGLYNLLSSLNTENFLLFAVGSRVSGKWRSSQEAQDLNSQFQTDEVQTSPYEYWSTAKLLPSSEMYGVIGADAPIILTPSNETHKVIIPPTNE